MNAFYPKWKVSGALRDCLTLFPPKRNLAEHTTLLEVPLKKENFPQHIDQAGGVSLGGLPDCTLVLSEANQPIQKQR